MLVANAFFLFFLFATRLNAFFQGGATPLFNHCFIGCDGPSNGKNWQSYLPISKNCLEHLARVESLMQIAY